MLSKRSSWPSQRAPASPAQSCAASASLFPPELFIIALPVSYQSKSAHDAEGGERPIEMAGHETGAEDGALDKSQPPTIALYTRSAERRVGKGCVSQCRSRWSQDSYKKKIQHQFNNQ